jgi:hypothetical protein
MAGTGKVPRKGPAPKAKEPEPEEPPPVEEEAEAGEAAEAEEAKKPARGLRTAPLDTREHLPAGAWTLLGLSVVLFAVAGVMFFMPLEAAAPEVWMIVGAVCGIGGFAALAYFFDKWGKL